LKKSIILVAPNRKKSSSTYWHIVFMLNLKFQPDKFKNNEEKAIIVFFAVLAVRVPFKSHHIIEMIIENKKLL
jgi:hypothetical protein